MTFSHHSVTVDDRPLRYLEAAPGEGAPRGVVVLLHAFPMNARMWEAQLPLAASGWRLLAPQFRQFDSGGDDDPAATSMDDYAADVERLLGALAIDSAVLGGLSMGGYVAFALLRRSARLARGVVLADTKPQADTPEAVEGRRKMLQLVAERGPSAVADEMIPKLLGQTTRSGRPDIVDSVRALAVSSSAKAIAGALTAMMTRPDSTATLAAIDCPACVIVGAEDSVTPPGLAEDMHRRLPGSQLSVIAAAGHLTNMERPDAFNRVLKRFLDTIPARRP